MTKPSVPKAPEGYQTVNSFIITKDAENVLQFLRKVFHAKELVDARTVDTDGLILHSEVIIGDSIVMVADRKADWPYTPSLLRVYVDNLEETLKEAQNLGAKIVTNPTDFYGDTLSRIQDKWGNIWWIYEHQEQEVSWEASEDSGESWDFEPSEELTYIHDSLWNTMRNLKEDE